MFGSSESHLTLDTWMVNREVTLQFKTSNPNGVIAYAGGNSGNYLELELRDGALFFAARKGTLSLVTHCAKRTVLYETSYHKH